MIIYILGWGFYSLFLFLGSWRSKNKRIFFLVGTAIFVYCMFGLRSFEVGTDTQAYKRYFELYKEYSLKELLFYTYWFKDMEPGYVIICKVILLFTKNAEIFLKIIAMIFSALFVTFLNKLDEDEIYWCAFTYYGLYALCTGLNIMRQGIAMLIILHAYLAYRKGKTRKVVILCFMAFFIHMSSILASAILIPFTIIKNRIETNKYLKWILLLGVFLCCFLYRYVFQWLGILGYLNRNAEIGTTILIMMCYLYIILMLTKKAYIQKEELFIYYFLETNILILIIMNFMSVISPVFTRLTTLLIIFPSFIPSKIKKSGLNANFKFIVSAVTYILVSIYFFRSLVSNIGGIVPFRFM